MQEPPNLSKEARQFAKEMGGLLNRTVTNGTRLNAVSHRHNVAVIGHQVNENDSKGTPIPLTINKKKTNLYLHVSHTLVLDTDQVHPTYMRSNYSLQVSAGPSTKDLIVMDYTRDPKNKYPAAHIHIGCDSEEFSGLFKKRGLPKRTIRDLHIPVGGRRYRPCLEDLIEFCILEGFVEPRNKHWQEHINHSREAYYDKQAAAVVRRSPEIAARVLRKDGWKCEKPTTESPTTKS